MKETLSGVELVALWRNGEGQNNPAGPLFAAGEFAEAEIVYDCSGGGLTRCSGCSGSAGHPCC